MTPKTRQETAQKTSRKRPTATSRDDNTPRDDKERDMQEALVEEFGETADRDRDLVHGEGGTIDLPTKPGDLSKDD